MGGADFSGGTGTLTAPRRLIIPNGTAVGTAFPTSNGELVLTQRAAGSVCLVGRLNGTTYFVALTAT